MLGTTTHPWLWDCHSCRVTSSALGTEVEELKAFPCRTKTKQQPPQTTEGVCVRVQAHQWKFSAHLNWRCRAWSADSSSNHCSLHPQDTAGTQLALTRPTAACRAPTQLATLLQGFTPLPAPHAHPWLTEGAAGSLLLLPQTGPWPRRISQDPQLLNTSTQQHLQITPSLSYSLHMKTLLSLQSSQTARGMVYYPQVYFTTLQIVRPWTGSYQKYLPFEMRVIKKT